jgi:hypothetical protein
MAARRALTAGLVALTLCASPAQADAVPPSLALMVMLKVLTYDSGFPARGGGTFVVVVPYAPAEQGSADEAVSVASHVDLHSINDRRLKFVAVPLANLGETKASAVLLPVGLSTASAKEALQVAARAKLYTLAFDESLVRAGAMLGVTVNAGKPQVVVNVSAARASAVDFSASVLKVAKTYQ